MKKLMIEYYEKELKKHDIDISKDDYREQNNGAFKYFDDCPVLGEPVSCMASWFIEKNIVGQERLERIYGKYALGISRKLDGDELNIVGLANEIVRITADPFEDIMRKISRNDGHDGLVERLKSRFNFDFNDFINCGNGCSNYKREKLKLLNLLYFTEKDYSINIFDYLNKPSSEDIETTFNLNKNFNGDITKHLKRNIDKELDSAYRNKVMVTCCAIAKEWNDLLKQLRNNAYVLYVDMDKTNEIRNVYYRIKEYVESINLNISSNKYKNTILETFYLKLVEHEQRGIINDASDSFCMDSFWLNESSDKDEKYREYENTRIEKRNVKEYMLENRKKLQPLIFHKNHLESNDTKKYKSAVEDLPNFLSMLDNVTDTIKTNFIPAIVLIFAIQEIIMLRKETMIDNRFFRYNKAGVKSFNSELYSGNASRMKSQMLWTNRVMFKYLAYTYSVEYAKHVYLTEKNIDIITKKIFSSNSIEDMCIIHQLLLFDINVIMTPDYVIYDSVQDFNKILRNYNPHYKLSNMDDFNVRALLYSLGEISILYDLCNLIMNIIRQAENAQKVCCMNHEIELSKRELSDQETADEKCVYIFDISVDPIRKSIDVPYFGIKWDAEERVIFEEYGLII